jgi:alpha-L-fucosidase
MSLSRRAAVVAALMGLALGTAGADDAELRARWQKMHAAKAPQLEDFNEAKFGMFIHWGLYAIPAGEWKGEQMPGISEWIMQRAKIPRDEYAALAKQFNPVKFDADEWVRIARDAGMRYMVITSKHHDGFAMYDSDVSDYDVVDGTPFGRDVVGELQAACKREGLRFGVYYSHSIDWYDGGTGDTRSRDPRGDPGRSTSTTRARPASRTTWRRRRSPRFARS